MRLPWLVSAAALAALCSLAGLACSSSSSGAPPDADAASLDSAADSAAGEDTGTGDDASPGVDTGSPGDGGAADAAEAGPPAACGPGLPCGVTSQCCVDTSGGTCGATCGCALALKCTSAADCPQTQVCCLQPTTIDCSIGTHTSTCQPTCLGSDPQLCSPLGSATECLQGSCKAGDGGALVALGFPADAGYGVCR